MAERDMAQMLAQQADIKGTATAALDREQHRQHLITKMALRWCCSSSGTPRAPDATGCVPHAPAPARLPALTCQIRAATLKLVASKAAGRPGSLPHQLFLSAAPPRPGERKLRLVTKGEQLPTETGNGLAETKFKPAEPQGCSPAVQKRRLMDETRPT